ncbi:hypothetical protein D3C72_1278660 [compost metagenome]
MAAGQADVEGLGRDDDADIHPMSPCCLLIEHAPAAVATANDPSEAIIASERIAARRDEIDDLLKGLPGKSCIGCGPAHLFVQLHQVEGLGTGAAHDVLGQDVARAGPGRIAVEGVFRHRFHRRLALQHFEPAGGDKNCAGSLVQSMVGPSDPLHQSRGALGGCQLDDQINRAPVDAQIQRRGADHRSQFLARHRGFHLAALFGGQAAVMKGDRQVVLIQPP